MKASKKIVGAACALIASVALAAGSTFAWFSSNSQVEVTGMRLQAVVPDALFIESGIVTDVKSITKTSLDYAETENHVLKPTTIEESSTEGTYVIRDADYDNWVAEPTGNTSGTPGGYIDIGTFNNQSTSFAAEDGKTPTDYAAMYVMSVVRINDTKGARLEADVKIFIDETLGDASYKFVRCGFLTSEGWVSLENTQVDNYCSYLLSDLYIEFHYIDKYAVIPNFDGNTPYTIQFVVWYDGPDKDCTTYNGKVSNGMEVQITYTVGND